MCPDSSFLSCEKGDLVILENDDNLRKIPSVDWYYGENYRSKECGDFPADIVYILPLIGFPSQNVLALFSNITFVDRQDVLTDSDGKDRQYTLEDFSKIYFRYYANVF